MPSLLPRLFHPRPPLVEAGRRSCVVVAVVVIGIAA
jgi:hypothetical protein